MKNILIKILISAAFVAVIIVSVYIYISNHRNEEASIQMDYSGLKDIDLTNVSPSYWNAETTCTIATAENGYYYISNDQFMVYFDVASGDAVPVCSKPECLHDSKECNAYLGESHVISNIYYYNGYIYYMPIDDGMAELCQVDPSGSSRKILGDLLPCDYSSAIHLAFLGDKAYAYDRSSHLSSESDNTEQIIEISLEDGSSSVIYEITGSSLAIKNVKCFGDKVFFIVQKKDSTVKDSVPVKSFGLFAYSQTTGEATTISEKDLFDYYFTDDGNTFYYYVTGEGLYRSDISTEQTELIYEASDTFDMCSVSADDNYVYLNNERYNLYMSTRDGADDLKYVVINADGNVINEISCEGMLELPFGDERYLFCIGTGQDEIFYIDKENISTATEWTEVFDEPLENMSLENFFK